MKYAHSRKTKEVHAVMRKAASIPMPAISGFGRDWLLHCQKFQHSGDLKEFTTVDLIKTPLAETTCSVVNVVSGGSGRNDTTVHCDMVVVRVVL